MRAKWCSRREQKVFSLRKHQAAFAPTLALLRSPTQLKVTGNLDTLAEQAEWARGFNVELGVAEPTGLRLRRDEWMERLRVAGNARNNSLSARLDITADRKNADVVYGQAIAATVQLRTERQEEARRRKEERQWDRDLALELPKTWVLDHPEHPSVLAHAAAALNTERALVVVQGCRPRPVGWREPACKDTPILPRHPDLPVLGCSTEEQHEREQEREKRWEEREAAESRRTEVMEKLAGIKAKAMTAVVGMALTDARRQRARNTARHFMEGLNLTPREYLEFGIVQWLADVVAEAGRFQEHDSEVLDVMTEQEFGAARSQVRALVCNQRRVLCFEGSFIGKILSLRAQPNAGRELVSTIPRAIGFTLRPWTAPAWDAMLAATAVWVGGVVTLHGRALQHCTCFIQEERMPWGLEDCGGAPLVTFESVSEHIPTCLERYDGVDALVRGVGRALERVPLPNVAAVPVVGSLARPVQAFLARTLSNVRELPVKSIITWGGGALLTTSALYLLTRSLRGVRWKSLREDD